MKPTPATTARRDALLELGAAAIAMLLPFSVVLLIAGSTPPRPL